MRKTFESGSDLRSAAGLSNFLAFEVRESNDVVQPTPVFGVDFLTAGTARISRDALATHRMRELLDNLRRTYSIILVVGPPADAATDVQILSAYQDGVVLLLDGPVPADLVEVIRTYRHLGIPLLGCVELAV